MTNDRILSTLGLATRARKTASGEFQTEAAVKAGEAFLVIVAEDASGNTKKKFADMCAFYEVPLYFYSSKDDLGHAMGKECRSSLAVLDQGFANGLIEKLAEDRE